MKPLSKLRSDISNETPQEDPWVKPGHTVLAAELRLIIERDQDWEKVTLTNSGTVVKYKKK